MDQWGGDMNFNFRAECYGCGARFVGTTIPAGWTMLLTDTEHRDLCDKCSEPLEIRVQAIREMHLHPSLVEVEIVVGEEPEGGEG